MFIFNHFLRFLSYQHYPEYQLLFRETPGIVTEGALVAYYYLSFESGQTVSISLTNVASNF
jgi:hypothetical protein